MNLATWTRISLVIVFTAAAVSALAQPIRGDGKLNFYYDIRKESLAVTFRDAQGNVIPAALQKMNQFLRSPDDQVHGFNIQLLDMVDAIQDHFQETVIELISGYRSPVYNKGLKDSGHAVANESLHMQGQAIDIHLDTVTEEAVRDYAQSLRQGGVGWYPQNDFVHVDLGPSRTWGHAENKRKWVGVENNTGALAIRSDANRYFKTTSIIVTVIPSPHTPHWTLEKFDRGIWKKTFSGDSKTLRDGHLQIPASELDSLPRGRYRLRVADSLSNEFYLKN